VDEARWFPIDEAAKQASFPTERKAIEEARQRLAEGGAPEANREQR
jgi:hypothetical protein